MLYLWCIVLKHPNEKAISSHSEVSWQDNDYYWYLLSVSRFRLMDSFDYLCGFLPSDTSPWFWTSSLTDPSLKEEQPPKWLTPGVSSFPRVVCRPWDRPDFTSLPQDPLKVTTCHSSILTSFLSVSPSRR